MSGITPKPEGEVEIINYDEFPNNILSKVGGKWEGFNMHFVDEDLGKDLKLYSGIAKGWMVWALVSNSDTGLLPTSIEFKFTYKSTEIITKISQWEKI
jgi:hypothetical protein